MKKSIFNVYVAIESQEQAHRFKQLCIDNDLPIWVNKLGWGVKYAKNYLCFSVNYQQFWIMSEMAVLRNEKQYTQVTEQEFIELLKQKNNE